MLFRSYVLAIVNSAAMNIGVHISFQTMVFSRYMPRSGIAGSYGGFIPSFFYGLSIPSSIVAVSVYIPTSNARAFHFFFPHPLQHFLFVVFDDGHSDCCNVVSHCSFDFHFSNNELC